MLTKFQKDSFETDQMKHCWNLLDFDIFFKISYLLYLIQPLNPQKIHLGYLTHFMTSFHADKSSRLEVLVRKQKNEIFPYFS